MKTCTSCGEAKPVGAFHRHNNTADGRAPRCAECKNAATKAQWDALPADERRARSRARQLWHRYRIRPVDYDELLRSQGGACAICCGTKPWRGDWLCVDHDHETGEIRGLLCGDCNVGLGKFTDNPDLLLAAADYLSKR